MHAAIHTESNPLLPTALIPTTGDMALISRQPIVDAKRAIVGYELLHRRRSGPGVIDEDPALGPAMVFNALSNLGSETLFSSKLAFVNCTHDSLQGVHLEIVDPEHLVLDVPAVEGNDATRIGELTETLGDLRLRGYRLAFGAFVLTRPYAAWCEQAAFIRIDVRKLKPETLPQAVRIALVHQHARVIAEKVESAAEFEKLAGLGVKLFQGYYFERPSSIAAKLANPAYSTVIQLLNLVRQEADPTTIEALLKRDPTLSYKLLRYINSAGFGLGCEVTSFRHAVMILGLKKLFRWAALLLTTIKSSTVPPLVAGFAITRARFMELLAAECLPEEDCDNAFLAGVFSMLDVMLGVPMEKALENLALPPDIGEALLERSGLLAPFLSLAEACEVADGVELAEAARSLQLSNEQINRAQLAALVWAEQFSDP